MNENTDIIAEALNARKNAQAPYSKFMVGAALLTDAGNIIHGSNVESASYGLSCCAERIAIFKALTDGHTVFTTLAIASPGGAAPCGACRQIIAEFAPKADIILIDTKNPDSIHKTTVSTLLPLQFTANNLPSN
tara:strand:+ start:993 stop:1394 length:402 start_codon:yes stop_codon:yes gene_type:complete